MRNVPATQKHKDRELNYIDNVNLKTTYMIKELFTLIEILTNYTLVYV